MKSDALFLTVPDDELASVSDELKSVMEKPMLVIHCSGLLSSRIFQGASRFSSYGYSIHPLLAVSSKQTPCQEISEAVFTIEGHPNYLKKLTELLSLARKSVRKGITARLYSCWRESKTDNEKHSHNTSEAKRRKQ